MTFESFSLRPELLEGIRLKNYVEPTPIQMQCLPHALQGRDVLGQSKTGTGKTAAFALSILQDLLSHPEPPTGANRFRALLLAPTRELAHQIAQEMDSFARLTPFKGLVITGGNQDMEVQEHALRLGGDYIIATPGRIQDHLRKRYLDLSQVRHLVLDEADLLLEMGFISSIKAITSHVPERRQTYLFSATLPPAIQQLARELLHNPVRVQVDDTTTPDLLLESVYPVPAHQKGELLRELLKNADLESAIIFVRTRNRANLLAQELLRTDLVCEPLHAELSLDDRLATLQRFRNQQTRALIATDLAARGLDIPHVSHVINFELPDDPSDYVHRVGRAGRAGRPGVALSLVAPSELILLGKIEHFTHKRLKEHKHPDFHYEEEIGLGEEKIRPGREHKLGALNNRGFKKGPVENPFTKAGGVRKKYQVVSMDEDLQKSKRKRVKIRKKLRHQR
jgi:ATP-dependent RNA helicase RhlE